MEKAQEVLLTGLLIDGKRAEEYGLVTRSFADHTALDTGVVASQPHLVEAVDRRDPFEPCLVPAGEVDVFPAVHYRDPRSCHRYNLGKTSSSNSWEDSAKALLSGPING